MDLGRALARLGQWGGALKHLSRAINLAPEDTFARLNIAYILAARAERPGSSSSCACP